MRKDGREGKGEEERQAERSFLLILGDRTTTQRVDYKHFFRTHSRTRFAYPSCRVIVTTQYRIKYNYVIRND